MRIAITGGSGSLGSELINRLCKGGADRVVTFTRDEQKRAALANRFEWHPGFRAMAGDVRDIARLRSIFYGCEVVIHAAARKVVTAHPDEPGEMLKTNVIGTENVINAAMDAGVGKLLLISSDKAVRPENVYGVSKAMAEHLTINANARTFPRGLRCSVLRYGNVLASNGSVVRLWRADVAAGKPLSISDQRMTRFWLTLPRAVDFVLRSVATMRGGETFIPHLPAAPITLLAQALYKEAQRDTPLEVRVIGIRPGGEKLHEELMSESEIRRALKRDDHYIIPPFLSPDSWDLTPWMGNAVDPVMVYRSDIWPDQLNASDMLTLLNEA